MTRLINSFSEDIKSNSDNSDDLDIKGVIPPPNNLRITHSFMGNIRSVGVDGAANLGSLEAMPASSGVGGSGEDDIQVVNSSDNGIEDDIPDIADKRNRRSLEGMPTAGTSRGGSSNEDDFSDTIDVRNLHSVEIVLESKIIRSDDDIPDIADARHLESIVSQQHASDDDNIPDIVEQRNLS
jgi:hypothetical protein